MSFVSRFPGSLGAQAVSMAANARDGLRAAHYVVQELAAADDSAPRSGGRRRLPHWLLPADAPAALIARVISQNARIADRVMSWSSDAAATLLVPESWTTPSPFSRDLMPVIAAAAAGRSFAANATFNAYFCHAADEILQRCSTSPFLVLENRIDAARRALAAAGQTAESNAALMARVLVALVRAAPVAEAGTIDPRAALAKTRDANAGVAAIACAALLLGAEGKPLDATDETDFFRIVGALIAPRLQTIEALAARDDVRGLEAAFSALQAMY